MLEVFLKNVKFFSFHGVHAEEQVLGGEFEVDLSVLYHRVGKVLEISETVNYVSIYELVKERMSRPEKLLETLAFEICEQVLDKFIIAQEVNIKIRKMHAPIVAFRGVVGVGYSLKRKL
ncbi:MAG: folB [Segetibacter sp.]|nr:folB [Segetibacter sp.]